MLERLGTQVPEVCELVDAAEEDLLAFDGVSRRALEQVALDNPLEHVNREIGRRSDVIGIFPNDASAIRLAGAVRVEQNDEWLVARRYVSEGSMPTVTLRERGPNESHDLDQTKEVTELLAA